MQTCRKLRFAADRRGDQQPHRRPHRQLHQHPPTDGSAGALSCVSTVTGDTSNAEHNVGSGSGERQYTLEVPAARVDEL